MQFDADGPGGSIDAVNDNLGTPAAFTPTAYSDDIIGDLISSAGLDLTDVEIRIKRATDTLGTTYQQDLWRPTAQTTWTWDFDSNFAVEHEILAAGTFDGNVAPNGSQASHGSNTRDEGANDYRRIFTWDWDGHNYQQGFSYGSGVNFGTNNETTFIWESGNENHALPYSEIYIRARNGTQGLPGLLPNDIDPDTTDTRTVSAVQGNAGNVGNATRTQSGGLLTVNADGSFSYDPDGALDHLSAGEVDTDTFQYTVSDGTTTDTATASITVTGERNLIFANDDANATDEDTPLTVTATSPATYADAVKGDAPVAYYPMDDATDSHAGFHGSATNVTFGEPGIFSGNDDASATSQGAATFNGTNSSVDIPHSPALNPAGSFSVESWSMVTGGAGNFRSVITSRDGIPGDTRGYILYAGSDNRWQFWTGTGGSGGTWDNLTGPAVTLNQWTHVVMTFDAASGPDGNGAYNGTKTLYVDGAQVAQAAGRFYEPNAVEDVHIGAGSDAGNQFFLPGSVDEVSIYDSALSGADVTAHYDAGTSPGVLANDFSIDVDGSAPDDTSRVIYSDVVSANGATVNVGSDGSYTYDSCSSTTIQSLAVGETLADTFTYAVEDETYREVVEGLGPIAYYTMDEDDITGTSVANRGTLTGQPASLRDGAFFIDGGFNGGGR
jgi:VCBS repeat-containing protein